MTSDNKFVINGHTYAVTQQDNEITNTYEIPKTDYTATKKWSGDTNVTRPTMTFTLWRKAGSVDEAVPGAEVKEVDGTTTTAKWTGLDKTTATGAEYSFYVKEAFKTASPENDNWILGNFDPATNSITNTVKTGEANLGKLTVKKKPLVNGLGVRSAFRGASLRGTPVKFGFTVTGPNNYSQTFELAPGESKVLKNLYFGEYTVTETNAQDYTPSYAPGQNVTLKTDAKTATVEVTNTGGGAGTVVSKTVEKVWVNGPKPTTTIELWRKNNVEGSDKIDQKVDEFVVPENASGEQLKKTFANLAKHDPKGNEFEYYVKEETVPENYTKNIEVMKVTNTYTQPSAGKVTITKVWDGPANLTKPEVNLTLYRKIEGGTEEQVPTAEAAVKVVDGSTTTAEWTGLKTKDINGKPYSFSVKESFKNAGDVNNGNWTLVDNTDVVNGAATITNKAVTGEDKLGKLTVTKKPLVNGPGVRSAFRGASLRGTPVKFGFTVTGPNNYSQTFELAPGESKELKNLYFGGYTVTETNAHGYTATYSVTDGKVTLKAEDKEKTVEVTNTSGGPGTVVEKTIKKVWVNGGKPDTVIELWRKGTAANGSAIDEKVGEFTANATKTEETFSNLAKHDPKGNEFEYYAKEPNVPGNYTDTYSADKLTVTNTYSQPQTADDIKATKTWSGQGSATPEISFTLYRKAGANGTEEQVTGTPTHPNPQVVPAGNEVNFGKHEKTDINGVAYIYYVKESFTNVEEKDNWTITGEDGLAVTNTLKSGSDTKAKLTIEKVLVNEAPVRTALRRAPSGIRGPLEFKFKVTGPNGYSNENVVVKAGESVTLDNLLYGKYKVEEIEAHGFTPSYAPGQEVTLKSDDKEKAITVTNTNGGGDALNVKKTVKKVWENGDKPATVIELWRKNNVTGADKIDEKVNEFTTTAGQDSEKEFTKTSGGKLLAKYDSKGNEFEYYAKEPNVPENYDKTENGLTVTNKYKQPQTDEDVKAKKTWTDADNYNPKPEIKFELWRKNGTAGAGEKVVDATALTNNEVNFGKQLKTDINGVEYTYFVKEIFTNAEEKDNWTITGDGSALAVDNKLKSGTDTKAKLTVKKVLINEVPTRTALYRAPLRIRGPLEFKFKVTGPGGFSKEFKLKAGEEKVFDNLFFGKYKVEEIETNGFTPGYAPGQEVTLKSDDKEKTVTVTNTNGGGDTLNVKKTVKKVWVNGDKPATVIELWRKNNVTGADKIDEKVNEFTTTAGQDSEKEFDKTMGNKLLAKYDPKGNEFEYYVKEPNVPGNYTDTYSADKLTVTNTYSQPQTDEDVKAKKTWTDADNYNPKPEIKFELWRKNGTAGAGEKVVDATALTNNEVNFGKQLKTDINGVEYTYFVKEIFTNAEEKDNWTITGDGSALAVDNKLKSGTETGGKLTIIKFIQNQNIPERSGLIRSAFRGMRGEPLKFKFKVTGPGGFNEEFELKAGEEKVFENLFFGEYTVIETESHGFVTSYSPSGGKVTITSTDKEKTVRVINKNKGGDTLNVKKTVKKVWENGLKPETTIELWRKGQKFDGTPIDEKVNEFTTTAGQDSEKEFDKTANGIDLAKYDPSGREFEYYAKEPNVPENYHESYSDDKLTVTNKFEIPQTENDVEALKIWAPENPAHVTKPGIKFELWRKGGEAGPIGQKVDGVEAKAPGSDNKVNFGKQEKTDINGVVYEYFVKEIFDNPDDPTVGNWEKTENGLNVTNKVKSGEETLGKLVITKKVVVKDQNGIVLKPDSNEKFKFRVTGEYGYESEFELGAGESKEIKNLYFGKYVVTEKDSKGYYTAYSKKNGEVEIRQSNKKESLDVINSKVVVDPPVEKEVIGNPENNDKFRFEFKSISNTAGIDNMPMPKAAGNAKSMTATITGSGSTEFGTFELTKAGTYIYEISEINDGIQGYKYDTSKYEVKYVVTKDENGLHAKTYITKNGKEEKSAKFVNTYKAKPPVKKKVVKKVNKKTVAETGDPIDVNMFAIMGMASILVILLMIVIAVGERRRQKE